MRGPKIRLRESGVAGRGPGMAGSRHAERVCWSWPGRTDCEAPARQAEGQAGNTRGCSSARRWPCQVREAALTGEWQVPAGRVPKATESGATACVSGHVGAGAAGRPGAASLPGVPLSWRYPQPAHLETPEEGRASPARPARGTGLMLSFEAERSFSLHPHLLDPELPSRAHIPPS